MGGRSNKAWVPHGGERIAVLALQRLGDVLTAARVTEALSRRASTASVEVIHWDATAQAAALLPGASVRHALPFGGLRRAARAHPLAPLRTLSRAIDSIVDARGFDRVINLSSTRFACWLAPALLAPGGTVAGPSIDPLGRYAASTAAITYLNEWGVDPSLNVFAHQDLYAHAAGVRLAEFAGLRDGGGRRSGPIVFHPFGSERAKDWRTIDDWRALVGRLRATFGRPCVIMGAPFEADALADIARGTGATVATWPLSACVGLLDSATGLVSVDTVAIHLAALLGCPNVALRQGPARGLAFVAGTAELCVDAEHDMATIDEVVALAERHFTERPIPLPADPSWRLRLRIREGYRDHYGFLGLSTPSWCRADPDWKIDDTSDRQWRSLWRTSFDGEQPPRAVLEALMNGTGRHDAPRWDALLRAPDGLGCAARGCVRGSQSAA